MRGPTELFRIRAKGLGCPGWHGCGHGSFLQLSAMAGREDSQEVLVVGTLTAVRMTV